MIAIALPAWAASVDPPAGDRMDWVVGLAARNVAEATGGPFAAAVFCGDELVSIGLNVVLAASASVAHAEVMALTAAQQRCGSARLPAGHALWTSAQPCAMCFGAVLWSGVAELVTAARGEDVEALAGFDEGPLPEDWVHELERRGIAVRRDVGRDGARTVLESYAGPRY